jgi:nitrogen fixation protein FixH
MNCSLVVELVLTSLEGTRLEVRHKVDSGNWIVQVTAVNVDIAIVAPKFHLLTDAEIQEVIDRL